jgi:hypothetical protein
VAEGLYKAAVAELQKVKGQTAEIDSLMAR